MGLTRITSDGITDGTISTADLADQSVTLAKLPHGTSSNNGKFLRANNGADPTFETINSFGTGSLVGDQSPQLGGDLDTNDHEIFLDDNHAIKFGAGNDLVIESDGTNGLIKNHVAGSIFIRANANIQLMTNASSSGAEDAVKCIKNGAVELYHDNIKRIETTSSGASVGGALSVSNGVRLPDLKSLFLGDNDDFVIVHTGFASYINNNSGDLYIRNDNANDNANILIQARDGENSIYCHDDGAVELYHDNIKKFETTSAGATVTGNLDVSSGIDVTGASSFDGFITLSSTHNRIIFTDTNADPDYMVDSNGGHFLVYDATNNQDKIKIFSDGHTDIHGRVDFISGGIDVTGAINASSNVTLSGGDFSTPGNLDLGDSSGTASGRVLLGASDDLQIYHDGSNSYIKNATGRLRFNADAYGYGFYKADSELLAKFDIDGAVELYYDGSKKFETANLGGVLSGGSPYSELLVQTSGGVHQGKLQGWASGNDREIGIAEPASQQWFVRFDKNTSTGARNEYHWQDIRPAVDNSYDLGNSSYRWRNVYTTDLNLSNEGSQNDVDSTWGNYTIQEGLEDLFLINHRTGKKFKFNLTEVS